MNDNKKPKLKFETIFIKVYKQQNKNGKHQYKIARIV